MVADFPMLDNGYVYPADVRLTVYRDTQDWLMIIEALGAYTKHHVETNDDLRPPEPTDAYRVGEQE